MSNRYTLGSPEFLSTSALRGYCSNGRDLIRPLGNELRIAAEELNAVLREVPTGQGGLLESADSRRKARMVSRHLLRAAEGVEGTCTGLIRCYLSFERNFINNTPERSRRAFDLNG
ncbi:hypothetical protein [Amycolatopsis sp. PS_44_ISF1]|uniref:hypothetical protein n=1 Tax=Amycolatopsis sp. PS_44_ISF1 TaxID=2974917 RepID=UPI0028DD551C|nr:hypothetical protein [Amycolatopsis sp. PS_44_ISF1]MDT8916232.1 hypothetical protein [Amycolatopsis sp. PS_44_ISF1]